MTDIPSTPPSEGPQPPGSSAGSATGTSTGLDPKLSGLLAYAAGWVSGLLFYLIEKEHREVRFHAAQSLLVSLVFTAGYVALSVVAMIPVVGLLALLGYVVLAVAGFGLWIYLLIQGYNLKHVRLPVIGAMAEQWADK